MVNIVFGFGGASKGYAHTGMGGLWGLAPYSARGLMGSGPI